MASLAEIRAKLQASSQQSSGGANSDNGIFPHWNQAEGTTTTVRFLPDADPNNTYFWIERAMIKLPFAGIKGEANSKATTVQVPCMEMWGETCPVLTEVRPWFKDKSLEEMGRKYWKKRSYLFQGFVVDTKMSEDGKVPENPIRRFIIGSQIFNLVKNALMDSDIEELPTDYVRGLDFKITKTSKGGYADYSTSSWARRERALTEEETGAIEQYKLFDLKSFLPKKPGEVELKVIKEMFEASVDGEAFDMDRWGQYFKPAGMSSKAAPAGNTTSAAPTDDADDEDVPAPKAVKPTLKVESNDVPESKTDGAAPKANDILKMIRERSKQ